MSFWNKENLKKAWAWIRAIAPLVRAFSSGGQKDTWEKIDSAVNPAEKGRRD